MAATSGAHVRTLEQPGFEQPIGVEEHRRPRDHHDPAREAVEAVDQVDRVRHDDDGEDGDERREVGREHHVLVLANGTRK